LRRTLSVSLCAFALAFAAAAEDPLFSPIGIPSGYSSGALDPRVPTPEKVLGFRIGDRFVTHAEVGTYLRAVAAAAPERVRVETYGRTPEGRELLLAVVTSPENHARFEEHSERIRSIFSPSSAKPAAPPPGLPLFVWFSYGVHGDEASSPDAAIATLYHLAASRDAETAERLRRVVLTIDPMVNPDGRMRYLSWLSTAVTGAPDPNPDAREHHPAWPRGRTNHFGFDLNRDWAWVTQVETQARIARYRKTPPQVHVDFHEMSSESSYFFPPAAEPLHAGLHADSIRWLGTFGRANAAVFDERGWTYFVRETFDLFYPGYGDSWPFFNGAIGMTYEMAGGPAGGLAYRRRDGSVLTLKERALKHFSTGLSTLATASAHRDEILLDFAAARSASLRAPARRYVVSGKSDAYRLRFFAETLRAQGIRVKRADGDGTLVIESAQPSGALAAALLDERAEMPESFIEKERAKFLRREEDGFYDVTAWSLPTAFGLEASRVAGRAPAASEEAKPRPGRVERPGGRLGFLVRAPGLGAFPILARCAEKRVPASVGAKSFRVSGETYPVGSLFLRRDGAPPDLDSIVAELARSTGVDFLGVDSAWTEEGVALGSSSFVPWKPARVGLLMGPGVDRSSSGWALDAFHRVFRYPVSVLDVDDFGDAELARYETLIVPEASSRVTSSLAKGSAEALRAWVKGGGVLVGIGAGAGLLREKDIGLSKAAEWKPPRERDSEKDSEEDAPPADAKKKEDEPDSAETADADLPNRRIPIPGAIFRTRARPEHFLLFGSVDRPRVLLATDAPLVPPDDPFETVISIERDKPLASGHAWPEGVARMAGSPYLIAEAAGKGWAITFADDPNFRGFWLGTSLLFGNAAILAPSFTP